VEAKKLKILKEILGHYRTTGDEYLFSCPFCKHHKPKLSVNLNKGAKCWVCDWSSSKLSYLVRRLGNREQKSEWEKLENVVEVIDFAEDLFHEKDEKVHEQRISLPEEFVSLANKTLPRTSLYALNYLKERGVTRADIQYWKIGYCAGGLYKDRIIVPSFNNSGYVNYFIARTFTDKWPKYKNPDARRDIIFDELYINWEEPIVLVEGIFDAIKAGPNSIPILGSTLRENSKLFQAIIQYTPIVYMALDQDAEKKSYRIIKSLLQYGVEVRKISIHKEDVGELTRHEFEIEKQNATLMNNDNYLLYQTLSM
jgi:DNA primase